MKNVDFLIIGGSAAGLSAALFAARRGLKTAVITKDLGGQLASTLDIANYPGISFIEGYSLAEIMADQARRAGAQIITDEIIKLDTAPGSQGFIAQGGHDSYQGRALLLAIGKTPRGLGLPNEDRFLGRGVGYCAPADIRQAAGKRIVIVGGGGTAFAAAKLGAGIAESITIVHRNETWRAEKTIVDEVSQLPNVTIMTNSEVVSLTGEHQLTGVAIRTPKGEVKKECEQLLIGAGFTVRPEMYQSLVETNDLGLIKVNTKQETSRLGVYAAGDISDVPFNQAVISAGEGAKAALAAYSWLTGKPAGADWG